MRLRRLLGLDGLLHILLVILLRVLLPVLLGSGLPFILLTAVLRLGRLLRLNEIHP